MERWGRERWKQSRADKGVLLRHGHGDGGETRRREGGGKWGDKKKDKKIGKRVVKIKNRFKEKLVKI